MRLLLSSSSVVVVVVVLVMLGWSSGGATGHNITRILAKHPEFSTFNRILTETHLAPQINRRETITVLALDNAAMSALLGRHLPLATLKNIISFHILLDYFGTKKLHQITNGTALSATMFQATGVAEGSTGFVNITDLKGGRVGFGAEDNNGVLDARYVASLAEIPYNISVIQISHPISSPEAEAPTPAPTQQNLTTILSKQGCKLFADLLKETAALETYQSSIAGGLTVFCPVDAAVKSFLPKYKNLTAEEKTSELLCHGVPIYMTIDMLKSSNGATNTLATDGAKKFEFTVQNQGEEVTLETKAATSKITGTLIDQEPLVVYTINKVLLPTDLFKALRPVSAPAPAPSKARSPKAGKSKSLPVDANSPADSPADDDAPVADDDKSSGPRLAAHLGMLVLGLGIWAFV